MVVEGGTVERLDRFRHPAVEGEAARSGQLVVQRRSHQGVGEAVAVRGHLDEQAGAEGLLHGRQDLVLADARGALHDGRLELRADDGGGRQHAIGRFGKPGETLADHVPDSLGNPELVDRRVEDPPTAALFDGARFREVAEHLAQEERVAVGLTPHHGGQRLLLLVVEAVAGASRPLSASRSIAPSRRSSASSWLMGWPRPMSLSRYVTRTRSRSGSWERNTWRSRSSVGFAAQWRSSSTSRTGASAETSASHEAMASKRR